MSGLSESAFRRRTVCRTAATLGGPGVTQAAVPLRGPPRPVSGDPAGGASQCSSGTLRSHPPVPGQSAGSAAGRTGTPLLQEKEDKKRKELDNEHTREVLRSTCPPVIHHTLRVV